MPCVRGVLEQACRARAHRVKPARAARVEDMGAAAGPARWLEAAGWRRLAVLGRALGEFAHVSFRPAAPRKRTRPREDTRWTRRRTCWPMR
jgi:hypothetical protein